MSPLTSRCKIRQRMVSRLLFYIVVTVVYDFTASNGVRGIGIDAGGQHLPKDIRYIVPSKSRAEDTQIRDRDLDIDEMTSKFSRIITLEFQLTPFEIYLSPLIGTGDEILTIENLNSLHRISDEFLLRTVAAKRYNNANFKTTTIMQYRDQYDPLGILIQINKTLTYEVYEYVTAEWGEDQLSEQIMPDILSFDSAIISFYDDTQIIDAVLRRLGNHESSGISHQFQDAKEISFMRFLENVNPEMPDGGPQWIPELDIAHFSSKRNSMLWLMPTLIIVGFFVVSVGIFQVTAASKPRISESIHNQSKDFCAPVTNKNHGEVPTGTIC